MVKPSESYINFLEDLWNDGIDLPQDQVDILLKSGRLSYDNIRVTSKKEVEANQDIVSKNKEEVKIESEIISLGETPTENTSIFDPKLHVSEKFLSREKIVKADWMPKDVVQHEQDFVDWVNSIIFSGSRNMIDYEKFELYKKQAYDWLVENDTITNYVYPEDIEEFKQRELDRCDENSLYHCNKYGKIKDAAVEGGIRTYVATKAHEIIMFLFDSGYSFFLVKPRQMAATSTLSLLCGKRIVFNKNYFIKFITQDKEKGLEIYEDKIKASFTYLPEWMVPHVLNWTGNHLRTGEKGERKGRDEGVGSSILVDAPSVIGIAGGSPSLSLVDEAPNIPIFSPMFQDAAPTLKAYDPVLKKIRMMRQIIALGTGGDMEKGGKSFEFEYMAIINNWKKGIYTDGIIPMFFDFWCRPGMTQEEYDNEKAKIFAKTGPDASKARIKFFQQYPSTIEDVFLSTTKTLVDFEYILTQEKRLDNIPVEHREKFGYFEPEYDMQKPMPEGFSVPYAIVGARFVETKETDPRATAIIFQEPKKGWVDRYWQGTDPIHTDSGLSDMASAIFDDEFKTISAAVVHRDQNYKYTFLQCTLLGIYYDTEKSYGVKELLESNIGGAYRDFKESLNRFDTLIWTSELPEQFRTKTGSQQVGIDNKGVRNKMIVDKMFEMIQAYGQRIFIRKYWQQLKTFTCKVTDKGNLAWGPINIKYHKDDFLWACVYAYICRQCYPELSPKKITGEQQKKKIIYELYRDSNGMLNRKPVKVNI